MQHIVGAASRATAYNAKNLQTLAAAEPAMAVGNRTGDFSPPDCRAQCKRRRSRRQSGGGAGTRRAAVKRPCPGALRSVTRQRSAECVSTRDESGARSQDRDPCGESAAERAMEDRAQGRNTCAVTPRADFQQLVTVRLH
jgi:hypothetical protein